MQFESQRREIISACQAMLRDGLVTGTSGNISVRLGADVLVTPSGVAYEALAPDDLCLVSMTGEVRGGGRPPSSETPMHLMVYRASDAAAVVHTHSPYATAVGLVIDELPAVHYAIHTLGGPVRVAPYETFGSEQLAAGVAAALRGRSGALLRNHGAITVGAALTEAYHRSVQLEWVAALYWRASMLGAPAVLSETDLDEVGRQVRRRGYRL